MKIKKQCLDLIRSEQRRSNVMTMARIQSRLRNQRLVLVIIMEKKLAEKYYWKNKALFSHDIHFCFMWRRGNAAKELEDNFKIVLIII